MKTTIHKYLTALRMESAMEALTGSDASIVSVALEHGFSSHSHFTAAFTRWTGVSPREARRRARVQHA
jgi:AraC family transcriptional regulator